MSESAPIWNPQHATSPFDDLIGLRLRIAEDGFLSGHLQIAPHHHQPTGVVHGGVFASLGEAVASHATNVLLAEKRMVALGMSNATSFLRPATSGALHAFGTPLHRGRTTWVWDVSIHDDEDRVCALTRVTLAIRPLADGL